MIHVHNNYGSDHKLIMITSIVIMKILDDSPELGFAPAFHAAEISAPQRMR